MKKQLLWIFLLITLFGYCHNGWSVGIPITYEISLVYDTLSRKFTEKTPMVTKQLIGGSLVVMQNAPAKLLLNESDYPIKLNNEKEAIAGQTRYELFPDETHDYNSGLALWRKYSEFSMEFKHASKNSSVPIEIKNSLIYSNTLSGWDHSAAWPTRDSSDCKHIRVYYIESQAGKDCKAITYGWASNRVSLEEQKVPVDGSMKFVFDYSHKLKEFFDKSPTPAGLYTDTFTYEGDSIVYISATNVSRNISERYTFDFTIEKRITKGLRDFTWNDGKDSVTFKTHTNNGDDDEDIIHMHGRKLFSVGGAFNPLSTMVFNLKSSSGSITKGAGSPSFSLANKQAATQDIPYHWYVTDLNSGSRFPLRNEQNTKIKVSHNNHFNGALDFDFDVQCKKFTNLKFDLRFPLRIRSGQNAQIKGSPNNQLDHSRTLNVDFNVPCKKGLLNFKNSLNFAVSLKP